MPYLTSSVYKILLTTQCLELHGPINRIESITHELLVGYNDALDWRLQQSRYRDFIFIFKCRAKPIGRWTKLKYKFMRVFKSAMRGY